MQLQEVETIPGKPWQRERLRKWIERLAENRYQWFGKRKTCMVPSTEDLAGFV